MFTNIDVFSKHIWVELIKDKTHASVINAVQSVFERTNRRPNNIGSGSGADLKTNGSNFFFFKKNNINAYTTKNETKANYAERVIQTLKAMMCRYFSHKETYKYMDIIQELVSNYNNSLIPHREVEYQTKLQIKMKHTF